MNPLRQFPPVRFRCPSPPPIADDQRSAYCSRCGKHVHNLSVLSQAEQDQWLATASAPCVRYRRPKAAALPLAAAVLLWTGSGAPQAQAADVETRDIDFDMDLVIVGGALPRPPLASVFLEEDPHEEPIPAKVSAERPQ